MDETFLIVGLGNPGSEYEDTRHNAGFKTLDVLSDEMGVRYWKSECGALCAHVEWDDRQVILAKPQSFMNASGGPISQLMKKYGIKPDHLIVIHDELDIPAGTIRVKFGGGHAGHNGLRSIIDKTQTREWNRIRIGIGRPPGKMSVSDYVLRSPRGEYNDIFNEAIVIGSKACMSLIRDGLTKTQDEYN